LELDDGSSNFFTALNIEPKSYEVRSNIGRPSAVSGTAVIKRLERLTKSLNALSLVAARPHNQVVGASLMQRLRSGIESAVEPRLKASGVSQPSEEELAIFGMTFSPRGQEEFATFDSDAVVAAIRRHQASFFSFLLDEQRGREPAGLFDSLDSALRDQERELFLRLAEAGVRLVDVTI
jgi:hypothetical protein